MVLNKNYYDNKKTGQKQHTVINFLTSDKKPQKILFFNEVIKDLHPDMSINALKNKKLDIRKTILGAVKEAKLEVEKRLKK